MNTRNSTLKIHLYYVTCDHLIYSTNLHFDVNLLSDWNHWLYSHSMTIVLPAMEEAGITGVVGAGGGSEGGVAGGIVSHSAP